MTSTPSHTPSRTDSPIDLLVVGEINVDLILSQVNGMPELEKERIVEGMTVTLGSSSAILASNAAALGLKVAFVGRIGHDRFGAFCVEALQKRGVDTTSILPTDGVQTGLTCIFTSGRKRGMITYPGAMDHLRIDDIPDSLLASAKHVHLSSYYLQPGIRPDVPTLFQRAKELGLTTSFDTNWDPAEAWADDIFDVLPHVDVFLPNDDEARLISRRDTVEDSLDRLAGMSRIVVATCGSKGVIAKTGDRLIRVGGLPITTVDAVGAGDTFNSGFLSEFIPGAPVEDCIKAGILSSAFSTQYAGGTAAFDHMDAFRAFSAQHRPNITLHEPLTTAP